MPLDHFSLTVPQAKLEPLVTFLCTSLAHMGFKQIFSPEPHVVGLGEHASYLWLVGIIPEGVEEKSLDRLLKDNHIAFAAENAEHVRQFHAKALRAGGTCNGPPGLREHYESGYYAAFVLDPVCGVNFEVVCRKGDS